MTEPADGKATPSTSSDTSRSDAWQYTLFFGVALIAIVLLGLRPHYEGMLTYGGNTDDVRATMFVSGVGTPNGPSDELLYSNRLLGVGLKQLYQTHSGIPWYGIYLTGCHLFSHLAICFAWCRISGDWRVRIAVTAFSLGMGSYFWTSLQFTTTATLMALAGVSLVASAIAGEAGSRGGQTRSHRISHLSFAVVGWSFVVLAGFIRWHAALLTGALVLPIIVMLIVSYGRRVSTLKHLLLATIAVSTMFGMECWSQQRLRKNSEWREFKSFEQQMVRLINSRYARARIFRNDDKPLLENSVAALKRAGWSPNDAKIFGYWMFFDGGVFHRESVSRVSEDLKPPHPDAARWKTVVLGICRLFGTDRVVVPVLFLALAFLVGTTRRRAVALVATWAGAIALTAVLHEYLKIESHVFYSIVSGAFLSSVALACLGRDHDDEKQAPNLRSRLAGLFLVIGLGASLFVVWTQWKSVTRACELRAQFFESVAKLQKTDRIYLINLQFPFQRVSPYDTMKDWDDWKFLYTDGDVRSPRFDRFLRDNGIDDLTKALYEDPRLRLLCRADRLPLLAEFIREHHGVTVEWSLEREMPFITVFRMKKVEGAELPTAPDSARRLPPNG